MQPNFLKPIPLHKLYDILEGLGENTGVFLFKYCLDETREKFLYEKIHFMYHQSKIKFPNDMD